MEVLFLSTRSILNRWKNDGEDNTRVAGFADRAGEGESSVEDEFGSAEFFCRRFAEDAECVGAGDAVAYPSASEIVGDGGVPEGASAGSVLQ